MSTFALQIVTVSKELFSGEASELHCRGVEGDMTILAKHEPLITKLKASTLRVKFNGDDAHEFKITEGVLEVANNKVVVLCSPV